MIRRFNLYWQSLYGILHMQGVTPGDPATGSCPSQELSNARNAMPANLPTGYARAADIMAESVSSTLIKMKRRQMLKAFPVHF